MVERTLGSHSQARVEEDGQAYHSLRRDRYRQTEARRGNRWQLRAVAGREHGGRSQGLVGVAAAPQSQTDRDRGERRLRTASSRRATAQAFVVIVFQPAQVRAYAKFHLQWAKNDKIDAALIAAC